MPYKFDATNDYFSAQRKVTILIKFAQREANKENDFNRKLFLSLGIVQLVTCFQVFVESILKEYEFTIKTSGRKNHNLPIFLRLNSLNLTIQSQNIDKHLKNTAQYNFERLIETKGIIDVLSKHCEDDEFITSNFKMTTKYPLGKQGLNELRDLLKQIEGIDIFDEATFDINKLNEILKRRHDIIHENKNMQLTEITLKNYRDFMKDVVKYISKYLKSKTI